MPLLRPGKSRGQVGQTGKVDYFGGQSQKTTPTRAFSASIFIDIPSTVPRFFG